MNLVQIAKQAIFVFNASLIAFVAQYAVFVSLERLFPLNKEQKTFRNGFLLDVLYFFINLPLGSALATMHAMLTAWLFWGSDIAFTEWLDRSRLAWPLWIQVIVTLLIMDFVFYWQHWLFHHNRACWAIHQIHHSSTQLDWLSTTRLHVLEMFFFYVLVPHILLIIGFTPAAFVYGNMFKRFYNFLLHANVPWTFGRLGNFVASPLFHRWHHESSAGAKNLATMFSFYDHLFGTWHVPTDRTPDSIGIIGANVPNNLFLQQTYPFHHLR